MHLLQNLGAYNCKQYKQAPSLKSILADCQHGVRSQRSCETQLVQFFHDLVSNLDLALNRNHGQTDVIIMDFAKAFDNVPHRRLLYKLDNYGIRGSTHKWITSWLSGRFQKVVLNGQTSDPVPVLSGVPQGSVLGPVLFLIFINDIPENIRSSVRLFADDCVLYRNIESPTDCQILKDDLNSLAQWEADWQMKFNVAKCHSMRVTRHPPDKHIQFDYTLHQQRLEQVHLGTLRKLHTKHLFVLSSSMHHIFGIPIMKLRLDRWRRYREQLQVCSSLGLTDWFC